MPQVWDPLWAMSPAWGQKKKLVFSSGMSASQFKLNSAFLAAALGQCREAFHSSEKGDTGV